MISHQAKTKFKLFRDPFVDDVRAQEDVFLASSQQYIRESLWHAARHGGFLALIGESGSGKSVLRRDLAERIRREDQKVILISPATIEKARLTAGGICEAIISDVSDGGVSAHGSLEMLARRIHKVLTESSRAGYAHALVIEEAHDLHKHTLKCLKRFWEMEDGFKRLLGIILIGQPELKQKLDERVNYDAREVVRRCEIAELLPLEDAVGPYLRAKFQRVGADLDAILEEQAVGAIRQRLTHETGTEVRVMSYPLLVNNVVTRALNLAAEIGADRVTPDIVLEL